MRIFIDNVATCGQLLQAGLTRTRIDDLVARRQLIRLRRGWYGRPGVAPAVAQAVRLGGTLTCVSALAHHGIWVPPDLGTHLRLSEHHHAQAKLPEGVRACCALGRRAPRTAVDPLPTALLAAAGCLDDEGLVVVLDSVLNKRKLSGPQIAKLFARSSQRIRHVLREVDGRSEAGTESMVRFRLRRKGVRVRVQHRVRGVGRVDLLVGDRLIIEVDSREHHTGEDNYRRDRKRDRRLARLGYTVIRLTYEEVVYHWDEVEPDLLAMIQKDRHRRRANPSTMAS